MESINLNNISIVLHRPRFPENIGSAARAAANMGISKLVVVSPEDFDREKILKLATHAVKPVVDEIKIYDDMAEALAPFQYAVATSARTGRSRPATQRPDTAAKKLIPISQLNSIAVVFGPEDRGLSNEELKYCQDVIIIPTAGFHSLNVAQAVMIVCWELYRTSLVGESMGSAATDPVPELATEHDLEGMYDHLEQTLTKIGFLDKANPDHWMRNIRRMFHRFLLRKVDVNLFRGICRQINWYINNRM